MTGQVLYLRKIHKFAEMVLVPLTLLSVVSGGIFWLSVLSTKSDATESGLNDFKIQVEKQRAEDIARDLREKEELKTHLNRIETKVDRLLMRR